MEFAPELTPLIPNASLNGDPMKKLLSLITVTFVLSLGLPAAQAADAPAKTAKQNKMANCKKDATGKKGEERKHFMKACLSQ